MVCSFEDTYQRFAGKNFSLFRVEDSSVLPVMQLFLGLKEACPKIYFLLKSLFCQLYRNHMFNIH